MHATARAGDIFTGPGCCFRLRQMLRSGCKTSDHARGQGAGRFESAAYTPVCEHFERPATPPSGVRRDYETTSNKRCSASGKEHRAESKGLRNFPSAMRRALFLSPPLSRRRLSEKTFLLRLLELPYTISGYVYNIFIEILLPPKFGMHHSTRFRLTYGKR